MGKFLEFLLGKVVGSCNVRIMKDIRSIYGSRNRWSEVNVC